MAQTIDEYRANDENAPPPNDHSAQIEQLKSENKILKERIKRLDHEYFCMAAENDKLKSAVETYSENVLQEHNYNLGN